MKADCARNLLGALFALFFMASPLVATEANVLIENVTIVSPELGAPLPNAHVLLRNDRIAVVGNGKMPALPSDAKRIDGKGQFLIPGLIDGHVHLLSVPGMNFRLQKKLSSMVEKYEKQLPRSYLYFGYTTVVDLAVVDRSAIDRFKKAPLAPDVYDCGQPLPLANGYPMSYLESPERFRIFQNFLYDNRQKANIPKDLKASDHTPKAAVARVKNAGGICVKTHYEPGFDGEKLPTPTKEMLNAVAMESKKAGLPLLIHANSLEAQSFALATPPDIFVHGMWNWGKLQKESGLPQSVRNTLDKIASKGIGYMPTFQVLDGTRALFDKKYLDSPQIKKIIPSEMAAWFKTEEGQWFANLLREQIKLPDEKIAEANEKRMHQLDLTVNHVLEKKGRVLFGTDTPASPTYGNLPGWNGFLEMKRWAQAGIPLTTLLRAATLANAEAFGLEKEYGTVAAGKVANLALLAKNPLETVEAYDTINTVIIRGKVVDRGTLVTE